nr:hypothetical protein [uncultured Roseococcus sp.]
MTPWFGFLVAAVLFGGGAAHAQISHRQEGCAWGQGFLALVALIGALVLAIAQIHAPA